DSALDKPKSTKAIKKKTKRTASKKIDND
ncbi:uncharacterized protein METZ01_LOCUS362627, partial [marine metagenome]